MDFAWVESEGGSLIVVEESLRHLWGGYTNADYESACAVEGHAALVPFEEQSACPGSALVIGDVPAPTTYMEEFGALVQWIAASSDVRLVEVVREGIGLVDKWEDGPVVPVNGRLAVFDAALPGAEAGADELLLVDVAPGAYRLRTADIESVTGTCARVHKLDRLMQ